ncbi:agl cluster protein AglQ [Halorubrum sp. F4]|uniref:agl cluster protein AglQ n=1 Tax=Halorubrum sp. F4 TaxID=2989715 RepID=UPI002480A6A4|nr:agl cluster protein AglQ [Halorubrum sp. F4]
MSEYESVEAETITIHELLERSAESALEFQREDGSFPPGRNYTYDEPETPVRTTSHWTVTLSEVYDITGKAKFREAADAAVDYLLSDEIRPHGYTYYCRDTAGKDHCNGLIGQAYPIRGLAHAGLILERQDAITTAENVFTAHPFDEELGLWERVEVDGKYLSFDRTLNHQILFAAGGSNLIPESDTVTDQVTTFLDRLSSNMELHSDGVIKHYVRPSPTDAARAVFRESRHWPLILNEVLFHYYSRSGKRRKKEIGYQPVNLKGLAQLRIHFPEHDVWSSDMIQASLRAVTANECSDVGYGSINPGLSFALAEYAFGHDTDRMRSLIQQDLKNKLDQTTFLLRSDVVSDFDQSSAVSILAYLSDQNINIPIN